MKLIFGTSFPRSVSRHCCSTACAMRQYLSARADIWRSGFRGRGSSNCLGRTTFHGSATRTRSSGEIEEFLTGVRHTVEPDRILATVLFTDIVGATEKAAALGDRRWHDLLDGHNGVVRRELARFRGREIKTAGDGFFAAFDGPARAVRCACAVSQGMQSLGLEIRAGLHTGECEIMGDDMGGIAVHIGARIAALAAPREVLVSSTVKDLVAGSGLSFRDHGAAFLKGVPGEWRLFSVG